MKESLLSIEKECNTLFEDIDRFNNKVINFVSANNKGISVEVKTLVPGDKLYLYSTPICGIDICEEIWGGEEVEIQKISYSDADIYSGVYFLLEFTDGKSRRVHRHSKVRKVIDEKTKENL